MTKKICLFFGHYSPSMHVIVEYLEKIFPKEVELFVLCANKIDKDKYCFGRAKMSEVLNNKLVALYKLRKFIKKNDIDLVIAFGGEAKIAFTLFSMTIFTRTKRVFYSTVNPKISLGNSFFIFSQFFTNRFISCCKEVADVHAKYLFFKRKQNFYLPFPVNVHIFHQGNKNKLRNKFGFEKEDKILIYVGRIEAEQGSDYLLQLIEKNPNKKFLFIGEIRDEHFKNKKFDNLTYIPHVPNKDLPDYYSMADLTIFFSKRNSYPYPPRESLACGVPVMLFDLNTFGQLTTPSVKKVPFDIEKMQQEINRFFLMPEKERKKLSKEGRKFIIEDSSEEKIKDPAIECLLGLLK